METTDTYKNTQILYNLSSTNKISDEIMEHLKKSLFAPDEKIDLERFFCGYRIEDIYWYLISCLPNVELIHGLKQEQLPKESKDNYKYQVPDYFCIYRAENSTLKNILIDVKSVKDSDSVYKFNKKQLKAISNYSHQVNADLWIAIYWKKNNSVTHISADYLLNKNNSKIKLEEAYLKDLSYKLGDYLFVLLNKKIFIKTTYKKESDNEQLIHTPAYGYIVKEEIATEKNKYIPICSVLSAIVDSIFIFQESRVQSNDIETIVFSEANSLSMFKKLTSLILEVLIRTNGIAQLNTLSPKENKMDIRYFNITRDHIISLMKLLNIPFAFLVYEENNNITVIRA